MSSVNFFLVDKITTIQALTSESWSKIKTDQQNVSKDQPWAAVGGLDGAIKEVMESVEQVKKRSCSGKKGVCNMISDWGLSSASSL